MAKELPPLNQSSAQNTDQAAKTPAQPFFTKKIVMIGVPIFVVQLAIIYFLMAKFIAAPQHAEASPAKAEEESQKTESATQNIFLIKDVIINPAGTNGTRFSLLRWA